MSYEPPRSSLPDAQASSLSRYRKFCVVVDGSPESRAAIRFAAGRAAHTIGGRVVMIHAIDPPDGGHWAAVRERMEEEARDDAEAMMRYTADRIFDYVGLRSEVVIAHGKLQDVLLDYLKVEDAIFALTLGATSGSGKNPLVDFFSGDIAGDLPCPVVIVPGSMAPERIDTIV